MTNTRPYITIWQVYCTVPFAMEKHESYWTTEKLALERMRQVGEGQYGTREIRVFNEMNEHTRWYLGDD